VQFCVDQSAFLDAWERYYAPDVFPGVWREIDRLMRTGAIGSCEAVYNEMEKKSDGVITWAKRRKKFFLPPDDVVFQNMRRIMARFREGFVDPRTSRSGADPFVIATAMSQGATVVASELRGKKNRPRIPDVCDSFSVPHCSLLEMLRRLNVVIH